MKIPKRSYIWITPDGKRTRVEYEMDGEATPYMVANKNKTERRERRKRKFKNFHFGKGND